MDRLKTKELFTVPDSSVSLEYLMKYEYPWEALGGIKDFILELGRTLSPEQYDNPSPDVWISKNAKVAPTAFIGGPTIIMEGAEVRHCAFIRGSVLVGNGATVGNSTELKNCILFDKAQAPHFNYIGDSILGYAAHTGAGAVTSNLKSDKSLVSVKVGEKRYATGLKKFGAILGDFVEVGCGSVLNPGTVIGRESNIYPLSSVRGFIPERSIFKGKETVKKI